MPTLPLLLLFITAVLSKAQAQSIIPDSCSLLQLSGTQSCRGKLLPASGGDAVIEDNSCSSSLALNFSCRGFLLPLEPVCERPDQDPACKAEQVCEGCAGPIRVDTLTKYVAKTHCEGTGSLRTVYGLNCRKRRSGESSCAMGSEGFALCDTEFLFFRDGHWYDWDLCSLCTQQEKNKPLTSSGYQCDGPCTNSWNNREIEAPRCKVLNKQGSDPALDFCTTCEPNCTTVQVDNRPGNLINHLIWQQSSVSDGGAKTKPKILDKTTPATTTKATTTTAKKTSYSTDSVMMTTTIMTSKWRLS